MEEIESESESEIEFLHFGNKELRDSIKYSTVGNAGDSFHSHSSTSHRSSDTEYLDDRVKSAESMLKMFLFEPSKYTDETQKCIAFWKYIESRADFKPVDATLLNMARPDMSNKTNVEVQTDHVNDEDIINLDQENIPLTAENCPWVKLLMELKQRKMDKAAKIPTWKNKCRLCKTDIHDEYNVTLDDGCNHEYLRTLDNWDPLRIYTNDVAVPNIYDDIYESQAVSAMNSKEWLNLGKQPGAKFLNCKPSNRKFKVVGRRIFRQTSTTDLTNQYESESSDGEKQPDEDDKKRVTFIPQQDDNMNEMQTATSPAADKRLSILKGSRNFIQQRSEATTDETVQSQLSEMVYFRNPKFKATSSCTLIKPDKSAQMSEVDIKEEELVRCLICNLGDCNCIKTR